MAFELKIVEGKVLDVTYKGTVTKEEVLAVRQNAITIIDKNSANSRGWNIEIFINKAEARNWLRE